VSLPALTIVVAKLTKQVAVSLCDYGQNSESNVSDLTTLDLKVFLQGKAQLPAKGCRGKHRKTMISKSHIYYDISEEYNSTFRDIEVVYLFDKK
jgi:hypothetical protein